MNDLGDPRSATREVGSRRARPLNRVTVVLPEGERSAQAALADALAFHLGGRGVQVARHVRGLAPEGALRADAALWLPDDDGQLRAAGSHEVPARLHLGLVGTDTPVPAGLVGYDALVCVHEAIVDAVRRAAERVPGRVPNVVATRLPVRSHSERDAEKAARRVGGKCVVLVDVRDGFERDVERVVFQLALRSEPADVVLLVPHSEKARARVRMLCERHEVQAWLASGPEAFVASVGATDLVVGRPSWMDVVHCAAAGVDLMWLEAEDHPRSKLIQTLREGRAIGALEGVLHLAAGIDTRLLDVGGSRTAATLLTEHLVGEPPAFLEMLGSLETHVAAPRGAAAWERVGPGAAMGTSSSPAAAGEESAADRAERIEDELEALKARLHASGQQP